jgi:ribosomal protein S18 acetylase RimI-like enzyme
LARGMPAMHRTLTNLQNVKSPRGVEITEVKTQLDKVDWLNVLMEGFTEPVESRTDFQEYLEYSMGTARTIWRHFLARQNGEACAISTLLCAQQAAGIFHVTTLPRFRGQGLGKALTLAAMRAGRDLGYSNAVLFATPEGFPLYKKLGFETVVTADIYGWNGKPD